MHRYGLDFHTARGRTDLLQVQTERSLKTGVEELLTAPPAPVWANSLKQNQQSRLPFDLYDTTAEQKLLAQMMIGLQSPGSDQVILNAAVDNKHRCVRPETQIAGGFSSVQTCLLVKSGSWL